MTNARTAWESLRLKQSATPLHTSSLFYAGVVFIAATPATGPALSGAWLAVMGLACLIENRLDRCAPDSFQLRVAGLMGWLISLGFSAAASYLTFFYSGPPQTFGVTLLGVIMFKSLTRDYAQPQRLIINLIPPFALLAIIQIGAGRILLEGRQGGLILTMVSSAFLVLWVLRSTYLDLNLNLQRFWKEATRADQSDRIVQTGEKLSVLAEDLAGVFHWRYHVETQGLELSPGAPRILGLNDDEVQISFSRLISIYAPEERERVQLAVLEAISEGRPYNIEAAIILPSGERRFVATNGTVERNADGDISTFFGNIMDVTETRRRELDLKDSQARFRMLADHGTDIVLWMGSNGRIRYASPSVKSLGYTAEELVGESKIDFVHPEDQPRAIEVFTRLFRTGQVDQDVRSEYRVRDKAGQKYFWLEGSPTLITDPQTQDLSCIIAYRDVTSRRQLEDDLIQARQTAEEASMAKSEFLANMSHEIRTPLTAIIGFAGLLQRPNLAAHNARTYVSQIASSGDLLLSLVNDILDFARMENNDVQLRPTGFGLSDMLAETVDMFTEMAASKGIRLSLGAVELGRTRIVADHDRLRQLIVNLVSNALKFTDAGSVIVRAEYQSQGQRLQIAVTDTGIGVPADKLGILFQRFSQVDGSVSRRYGGTGLGLSICAKLAEAMGGGISVESQLGRGSTFNVWIHAPLADRDEPAEAEQTDKAERRLNCRVLVVDDVAANRELVRAMLEATGQQVEVCAGGEAAAELASRSLYDLIFMDLQMPGVDGFEATQLIRRSGGLNAATPIVALSANVLPEHREATRKAGMNGHVAKPISPVELIEALETWGAVRLAQPVQHLPAASA